MAKGVMWDVPVLVDFGTCHALIVSTVDRRWGGADCAVRYWLGDFDGTGFTSRTAAEGLPLDHGPDFYAAIISTPVPSDRDNRILVAWASNWSTARTMPWPGGVHGGPVTSPRILSYDATVDRLAQIPVAGHTAAVSQQWDGISPATFSVPGRDCELRITLDAAGLLVVRQGIGGLLDWTRRTERPLASGVGQTIDFFNDAGLIEIFIRPAGMTITAFVPGARI